MDDDEIIAVVQAYRNGSSLESRYRLPSGEWSKWFNAPSPCWDFSKREYRIKAEDRKLREWWLVMDGGEPIAIRHSQVSPDSGYRPRVHVREVLP